MISREKIDCSVHQLVCVCMLPDSMLMLRATICYLYIGPALHNMWKCFKPVRSLNTSDTLLQPQIQSELPKSMDAAGS